MDCSVSPASQLVICDAWSVGRLGVRVVVKIARVRIALATTTSQLVLVKVVADHALLSTVAPTNELSQRDAIVIAVAPVLQLET